MQTTQDVKDLGRSAAIRMQSLQVGTLEWVRMSDIVRAADLLAAFSEETADWGACLHCGLVFKTDAEQSAHYWASHR